MRCSFNVTNSEIRKHSGFRGRMNRINLLNNEDPIQRFYEDERTENKDDITSIDYSLFLDLIRQNPKRRFERRAYMRFHVKKDAFALIRPAHVKPIRIQGKSMSEIACSVFKTKPVRVGKINNISMGGLACHYIESKGRSKELFEMDILLVGCGFYLSNVQFKPISDLEIDDVIPLDTIKTRQLRAQFHTLTKYHKSQLDDFIRNHTTAEVYEVL